MALNIKNDETYRLVQELAQLTGESLTVAVRESVCERLERLRREKGSDLSQRLMAIAKDCAQHLREPFKSIDHDELLYGEDGLPQ